MRKFMLMITLLATFWGLSACSDNSAGSRSEAPTQKSGHTASAAGIAGALRGKTLDRYASATIGDAFDRYSYFTKKEWTETFGQNGKIYVDFIGWLTTDSLTTENIKNGIAARAVDVKFVVNPDGSFFVGMISKIETQKDGRLYSSPFVDAAPVLEQIYANRKIEF